MNMPTPKAVAVTQIMEDGDLLVEITWVHPKVDRPEGGGWSLPDNGTGRALALRLTRAIEAMAPLVFEKVSTDVNGQTYVTAFFPFLGRRLNADLKRHGF